MTASQVSTARIPVAGPWVTEHEVAYVTDAARNGWYSRWSEYIDRFEKTFAADVGVPFAISAPSGTAAIHLAMAALGIGPGDQVIVPECTWISSASPALYLGAEPVFADIDPVTWCLSPDSFEAHITSRTRAVVVVDLYGSMPDMDAIEEIARKHNIVVLEDAAEAIGSSYRGRRAGSFGSCGLFSFHGTKTITTGEGGMLVTGSQELFERCLVLRDQGRNPMTRQRLWNDELGYKVKMSSLCAAFGLAQVERVDELVARKREIFHWYKEELGDTAGITLNAEPEGVFNSYWMTTAVFSRESKVTKESAMEALDAAGIDSRPFFYPLSMLPPFAHLPTVVNARERNNVAYEVSARAINLPSAMSLRRDDVSRVSEVVRALV